MRILVIDDELSLRTLAVEYLTLSGHEAVACADGESALGLLRSDPGFDVIVLDKRLPGLSSAETLKAIKADPRLKDVPVVVLSASVQPGAIQQDLAAADMHMAKPFSPKDLAAAVKSLAGRKRPS